MADLTTLTIVDLIEAELERRGWLCTDAKPCAYCVTADEDLPHGWVRVYDDYTDGFGDGVNVLAELCCQDEGAEYGTGTPDTGKPDSSRDWPAELIDGQCLEEGTPNDNPNALIIVSTNGGIRYAAGPTGANYDALADWLGNHNPLAKSQAEAIATGCDFGDRDDE